MNYPPVRLTLNRCVELAELAVKEKGEDYIYERPVFEGYASCVYFAEDGSPSCQVGMVLHYAGVKPFPLHLANGGDVNDLVQDFEIIEADPITTLFLNTLQENQDAGKTWGTCLKAAKQVVNMRYPWEPKGTKK